MKKKIFRVVSTVVYSHTYEGTEAELDKIIEHAKGLSIKQLTQTYPIKVDVHVYDIKDSKVVDKWEIREWPMV